MITLELCKQILRDMRQHKIRSVLAMFGIVWGTVTVVLLLSLGESFYNANYHNMMSLNPGTLWLSPRVTSMPFQGLPIGRQIHIKASESADIKASLPTAQWISPVINQAKNISYQTINLNAEVSGVAPDYLELTKKVLEPDERFINAQDIQQQANVIFISSDVKDKLFKNANAVGQSVYLNYVPFYVIGVEKKKANAGSWYSNEVFIPYSTFVKLWGDQDVNNILLKARDENKSPQLQAAVIQYLAVRYHFDPADKSAVHIFDFTKVTQFFFWFFRSIQLFLGFCGLLTLAVGGIGIANIMYLIVLERTPEIGLRMAIGANEKHILLQFLLEAGLIVGVGSAAGFLISLSVIEILRHVHLPDWLGIPEFSGWILLLTIFVLSLMGLLAGYFPARRAANMNPVQALAF